MKRTMIAVMTLCLIVLSQSCSYVTVVRTKELAAVRDSLSAAIVRLEDKLDEQRQTQDELLKSLRADQHVKFSELEKEILSLGSNLSDNQYRLTKIDEKTADVQRQLKAEKASDSVSRHARDIKIEEAFQNASADFNAGKFDSARSGFKKIALRFPESARGRESGYWAAECLFAKKEYSKAEGELLLYIKKNPQGNKACVALYKLGRCYEKSNKMKSKKLAWKKLLEKCPESKEAQIVKSAMK